MVTSNLKIKNGEIIESQCMSKAGDISTINMDNYKCTDQWIKYENRRIAETLVSHSRQFSTQEEAKTACMELPIDDCASIEERHREIKDDIVFNLKRWTALHTNNHYITFIRPSCRSDG